MPQFPNLLLHAVPAFVLLIVVEVLYAIKIQKELYQV
ncbi:MAG TPA: C-5 sterol desaturase, partial [Chitinophagaceae bacterium]|nr:C-5 sterol desaturase [Chitinophagaceae bacterium]